MISLIDFFQKPDEARVEPPCVLISNRRVTPRTVTGITIICGDCVGDSKQPRKTFMASDRTCANCGGRSYELTETYFANIHFHRRKDNEHK